jgi:hypothetical protein
MGVADAMQEDTVWGRRACLPEVSVAGQARDVAVRYLTDHPESRHYTAASLVAEALEEAFPCPAATSQR